MSGWPVWTGTGYEPPPQAIGGLSPQRTQAALGLVAGQAPGCSLERAVHLDLDVYRLEIERIWRPGWLFAAHSAELAHPGARTVFDVGDDSVLVVRGEDGGIRAFQNLCRHRGNRLAARGARQPGGAPLIRCPYHDWVYGLDGSLIFCRGTDQSEGLDPAEHGLLPVASSEVGGLIFLSFEPPLGGALDPGGGDPGGLVANMSELAGLIAPGGFDHAKVAHTETYLVNAGWKVVWEDNPECWYSGTGHPEQTRSHFGTVNTVSGDDPTRAAGRTAVMGAALGAPPNLWCHAGADHAVTARLAPVGLERTEIVLTWLVDEGAVEGRDYDLDRLLPAWATASEQGWALCERNQDALRGPACRPGPLSGRHAAGVAAFHAWYREAMAAGPRP
jgi:Rieske 2Fe-2S family protein